MSACTVNLKGLNVVVHYNYTHHDYETGWGNEVDITDVYVLGNNEVVDDSEGMSIVGLLGKAEIDFLEHACRIDALKTMRIGEEV
jgi:hypothetical protein